MKRDAEHESVSRLHYERTGFAMFMLGFVCGLIFMVLIIVGSALNER